MSIRTLSLSLIASALFAAPALAQTTLLNVSYDPTRELYVEYNKAFNSTGPPRAMKPSPFSSPTAAPANRPAP